MRSFIKSHRRDSSSGGGTLDFSDLPEILPIENQQLESSPVRHSPSSPNSSSKNSNKLQRLFQRTKNSSQNLQGFNILPPLPSNSTASPSIIGTRRHEWGSPARRSEHRESLESQISLNLSTLSITDDTPVTPTAPLSPGVAIRQRSPKNNSTAKNLRRRAQIFTEENLAEAARIYSKQEQLGDQIDHSGNDDGDQTLTYGDPETDAKGSDNDSIATAASEFSFEQNNAAGRNVSIKYYKAPVENDPGNDDNSRFYIDDMVDDDFDDEMNYFDEDDEFNDDEELFNKKYFSDDDDIDVQKKSAPPVSHLKPEMTPLTASIHTKKSEGSNTHDQLLSLRTKRSLKYYQLPQALDQEYSAEKYSFLQDSQNKLNKFSRDDSFDSYDSLLDEINGVPEDFEFELPTPPPARAAKDGFNRNGSRNLNSRMKAGKLPVYENSAPNSTYQTQDKTVTLFNRSRPLISANSPTQIEEQTLTTPQNFSYSTPNSSFTTPNPGFLKDGFDLSPIAEGSVDGSP